MADLTITPVPGYVSLAILSGEDVAAIVEAAEAVIDEMRARPWLGEPEEWVYEEGFMEYKQLLETLPPPCPFVWDEESQDRITTCTPGERCSDYYDALVDDIRGDHAPIDVLRWLIANPDLLEEDTGTLAEMYAARRDL